MLREDERCNGDVSMLFTLLPVRQILFPAPEKVKRFVVVALPVDLSSPGDLGGKPVGEASVFVIIMVGRFLTSSFCFSSSSLVSTSSLKTSWSV